MRTSVPPPCSARIWSVSLSEAMSGSPKPAPSLCGLGRGPRPWSRTTTYQELPVLASSI